MTGRLRRACRALRAGLFGLPPGCTYPARPAGVIGRDEVLEAGVAAYEAWRAAVAEPAIAAGRRPPLYDPDAVYADEVKPGDCVVNPDVCWRGDERGFLDVMHVTPPDGEGMVVITAPSGPPVRIAGDWGLERYTPALADLEAIILIDAAQDPGEAGR